MILKYILPLSAFSSAFSTSIFDSADSSNSSFSLFVPSELSSISLSKKINYKILSMFEVIVKITNLNSCFHHFLLILPYHQKQPFL